MKWNFISTRNEKQKTCAWMLKAAIFKTGKFWMDKRNVDYPYNEILLGNRKESSTDMLKLWWPLEKGKKSQSQITIYCIISFIETKISDH